jgi:hypothetical protein
MTHDASSWKRQREVWAGLNALHPSAIDLQRIGLLRQASREELADPAALERRILELGLDDEALAEFPPELHNRCGRGLRIWQYPVQFSKYLVQERLR